MQRLLTYWLIVSLVTVSTGLNAQSGSEQSASANQPAIPAAVPDVVDLPNDWLASITRIELDETLVRERLEQAVSMAERRIAGLDEESRAAAESALNDLRNNVAALVSALRNPPPVAQSVIPIKESYTLEEVLELRAIWRRTADRQSHIEEVLDQASQQYQAVQHRHDRLVQEYDRTDPTTPTRVVTGIMRMAVGIELMAYTLSNERLQQEIELTQGMLDEIRLRLEYARDHVVAGDTVAADFDQSIAELTNALANTSNQRSIIQNRLVDSGLEDEPENRFRLLNLKQQLTLISAQESQLFLSRELQRTKQLWYRIALGDPESHSDFNALAANNRTLVEQTELLVNTWTRASHATMITPDPESGSRSQSRDYSEAQAAARESIKTLRQLSDTIDDLLLAESLTESRIYDLGLSTPGFRVRVVAERFWGDIQRITGLKLFYIGDTSVTIGRLVQFTVIILVGFLISWILRRMLHRIQERRHSSAGEASFYTLGRILHYVIVAVAVLAAFSALGLDTGSLTLIAGALSVGIGFGLQSIVSNFISGLILLFEGSLRVGDFVELDSGVTGTVREISSRFTRINTNDNIDVVVPNSELVSYRLKNWTLREPVVRVRVPFAVAYGSDKEQVKKAALEAVADVPYTIQDEVDREPVVLLTGFGESSLDFELRVWIRRTGVARPGRVRATYYWALESRLREHGIEIPFPQRDVRIRGEQAEQEADDEGAR